MRQAMRQRCGRVTNAAFHRNVEFLVQLTGSRYVGRKPQEIPNNWGFAPGTEPAGRRQLEIVTGVQRRLARQVWYEVETHPKDKSR